MSQAADPTSDFAERPWMDGAEQPEGKAPAKVDADRAWIVGCHVAPLLLWILYPYGSAVVIPLLIWQLKAKKDGNQRLASHAVESLNFQISLTLACIALSITIIGLALVPVVMIGGLVFSIIAGVKTYGGMDYRYPWIYRFIKDEKVIEVDL